MQTSRLLKYISICNIVLFALILVPLCRGQISSWTDENGVRHFSNVETSEVKKTVEIQEEYMTDESDEKVEQNRDRFQILRMYQQEKEDEEKQKVLEEEIRETEEKERKQREAEAKASREKRKACEERSKKLDELRRSNWEDYDAPRLNHIVCPDRRWRGARGRVFDNMGECTERRDKARKSAYERAVRQLEDEIETLCAQ